ncbi:MAG: hypothetical protein KY469_17890 [Actinobacteria bacterium]|nr:hypothetical protein [Actinomycetota bacterium]
MLWAAPPDPEPALDRTERISTDAPHEWQSAPTTSSWLAGDVTCETEDEGHVCERIHLQIVPDDGQTFGRLTAHIGDFGPVPPPVTDLDLYLYESDGVGHVGPRVDASGRFGLPDEPPGEDVEVDLTFVEGAARYVVVEVRHYQSTHSTYRGTASLQDAD